MSEKGDYKYSLDAINFLLADVRGAVGPYLNVFLVTQERWSQTQVGLVTMIGGILGLIFQTPIGAAIDHTKAKRALLVVSLLVLTLGAVTIYLAPKFWPVAIATSMMAVVGDVFGPAVTAITLGLYVRSQLTKRIGRNSAMDHAGNVGIAVVAGAVGWAFGQKAVFLIVPICAVLAIISVLSIPAEAIDHEQASGMTEAAQTSSSSRSWQALIQRKELLLFSLCIMLFHFANAPLLPLVGQKLAQQQPQFATAMMSACIIAAQLVMLPIALFVGNNADRWGRKPIFLVGFAILPLRAVLYMFSDNPAWLIAVQLLDGVGAGILGALVPVTIADIMRSTPHFNLAQGAVATMQGVGASVSGLAAGWLVDHYGYNAAFGGMAASALTALIVLFTAMPETVTKEKIAVE